MPGRIQSLERGAAILSLLGAAPDLSVAELADALDLPRPTVHGLLATLTHVGFVTQDAETRRYSLGTTLTSLDAGGTDPHDLRSVATSWCDSLAAKVRSEVVLCVWRGERAEVVHHVFRPDDAPQELRVGEGFPLHATAVGKVLLAAVPGVLRSGLDLDRYTQRTLTAVPVLAGALEDVRRRGWAFGAGEYQPEVGDVAAPVRGTGGLVVGAVGCTGPLGRLFTPDNRPRPDVVAAVTAAAAAIGRTLAAPR